MICPLPIAALSSEQGLGVVFGQRRRIRRTEAHRSRHALDESGSHRADAMLHEMTASRDGLRM
jgi:hypothetical protein